MTRKDAHDGRRRLLDVAEVMDRLQISRAGAYRLMKRLPGCVYIGKAVRLPEAALEAFLASGGDAWPDSEKQTSIFAGRPGGAGSTTTAANKSERARTKRTEHWLSRLLSESKTSTSRHRPSTKKSPSP
jgi:predicted DNA-binding transcriptional regulator AlpA